jgi:GNAT superfamily N-acetyltransferase
MKKFRVRVATMKDIDALVRQRHMMFEDMRPRTAEEHRVGDRAYKKWAVGKMKKGHLRCYLVTDEKGEVAGGGGIWLREVQPSPGHGARLMPYLLSMFTEPKFRRKGVATLVVKEAERWARASGYPSMSLHASRMGRRVYRRLGWERGWEMRTELE